MVRQAAQEQGLPAADRQDLLTSNSPAAPARARIDPGVPLWDRLASRNDADRDAVAVMAGYRDAETAKKKSEASLGNAGTA
jgi:hypothetical protein